MIYRGWICPDKTPKTGCIGGRRTLIQMIKSDLMRLGFKRSCNSQCNKQPLTTMLY